MDSLYVNKRATDAGDCFELCEYYPNGDHADGVVATANTLDQMHQIVKKNIICGVDWSRVEPQFLQKAKDWIEKNGQTETPAGCMIKAGDKVTYINDYGVIWAGKEVIGFDISPENNLYQYGKFVHLDTDAYWFPHSPDELVKESGRDITPEMVWIYTAKALPDGTHPERAAIVEYVREFHKETPDTAVLAKLKKQIKGK